MDSSTFSSLRRRLEDGTISENLVAAAANGDPVSQEQIFTILIPLFTRQIGAACRRRGIAQDPDLDDDLICDLALHFLERRDGACWRMSIWLANPVAPFEHWAAAVAANRLRTLVDRIARRRDKETEFSDDLLAEIVEKEPGQNGLTDAIRRCLQELPPNHRRVLTLRYLDGMSSAAIAKAMDLSIDSVYRMTHRAKLELRRRIGEDDGGIS